MINQAHVTTTEPGQTERPGSACQTGARIVVLGIGNLLLGDDGAGVHVVRALQSQNLLADDVLAVDGGTIGFTLLEQVEAARVLIIVDAMKMDDPPGKVRLFVDEELDRFLSAPTQRSVHDANVGDVLRMSALRGTLPAHRVLVGIAPMSIDWGDSPSEPVRRGIRVACRQIIRLIEEWR